MQDSAAILPDGYAGSTITPSVYNASASVIGADWQPELFEGEGSPIKGIVVAVVMEGIMVLCLLGIWFATHVAH